MRVAMAVLSISLTAGTAVAQDCTPVRFQPGTSGAMIEGMAPAEGVRCYSLSVRPGQQAHVGIVKDSDNVAVSVTGIADNRRSVDFVTTASRHDLLVHQTFRAPADAPFSMRVQVR